MDSGQAANAPRSKTPPDRTNNGLPSLRPSPAPTSVPRIAIMLPSPQREPGPAIKRNYWPQSRQSSTPTRQAAPVMKTETPTSKKEIPTVRKEALFAAKTETPKSTNRGRPKGWRPGMSYAVMRGKDAPAASATSRTWPPAAGVQRAHRQAKPTQPLLAYKKRGRPSRPVSPPPHELYRRQNPRFLAFLCEWKGCKAELHNLETLQKHVRIVHPGNYCAWGKCKGDVHFDSLTQHVEDKHLVPLSWHVGDGPRNIYGWKRPDGIPEFLKDKQGRQVTPSTKDQQLEDPATYKENRRKLKELLLRVQENLPTDDEDEDDDANGHE